MMVSFDVYKILNIIEQIVICVFGALLVVYFFESLFSKSLFFVRRNETYNNIARLICVCILFFINVLKLYMEIKMEKPYSFTIFLIIIWIVSIFYTAGEGLVKKR